MNRIFFLIFTFFCAFAFNACSFYFFDMNYYKAKGIAKKNSGVYVVDKELYDEIMQDLKKYKSQRLSLQKDLEKNIKNNKKWLENKEKYIALSNELSKYKNPKNAEKLFILEQIDEKYPHILTKNNQKYYTLTSLPDSVKDDLQNLISQDLKDKITKMLTNDSNFKLQRIIYPQYFYLDENHKAHIISVIVVYLYTNINRIYGLKHDNIESNIEFANGEWLYLLKNNVFYLE